MTGVRPIPVSLERLSSPKIGKATARQLSAAEVESLRRVASALIPRDDGHLGGGDVEGIEDLMHEALAIMDPDCTSIPQLAQQFDDIPEADLFGALRRMSGDDPDGFYVLSLFVSGVYLYSPEIERALGYPHPHRNPFAIDQVVDELGTGILEPVVQRGEIYVRPAGS
jgi:hypothetical protein